jgi:hypothetical protein
MLLLIIAILIAIIGFIYLTKNEYGIEYGAIFIIGFIFTLILGIGILTVNLGKEEVYEQKILEREHLIILIEYSPYQEELYHQITRFNEQIERAKKYENSIWFGWYTNRLLAKLEIIEYEVIICTFT